MDLPDRLMANALYEQNPTKAKADIYQALKDDPTLAERLKNPTSDADKAFAERLQKSIAAMQSPDGRKNYLNCRKTPANSRCSTCLKQMPQECSPAQILKQVSTRSSMSGPDQESIVKTAISRTSRQTNCRKYNQSRIASLSSTHDGACQSW